MMDYKEHYFSALGAVYAKEKPDNLKAAFQSLVEQTHVANQVVLVVDGPVPKEINLVIDEFAALLPLTVLRLSKNVGLALALNAGLKVCSHPWVARYDTDDVNLPNRFFEQFKFISENIGVVLIGSAIAEFSSDLDRRISIKSVPCTYEDILNYSRFRNPFNHMTVVFRKDLILNLGGYPVFDLYEDFALWGMVLKSGNCCLNVDMVLVHARAGQEMVKRRGGWRYLKAEFRVFDMFRRIGHINSLIFLYNIAVRTFVRLSPNGLRTFFYYTFLRKN